ncbi:MAG: hypothetical protein FJ034_06070 [Chloroflexi bacterium]|nr:hypothetical protein [Chloroflexota bacterium]
MSERDPDPVLTLLDDMVKALHASVAATIEVSADSFSLTVTRDGAAPAASPVVAMTQDSAAETTRTQHVHATTVGIFSAARDWRAGETVKRGDVLGGIQSLGHITEVPCPADGVIEEVLVTAGAPVEYGQPLFAITLA